jgi:hypothetical protein
MLRSSHFFVKLFMRLFDMVLAAVLLTASTFSFADDCALTPKVLKEEVMSSLKRQYPSKKIDLGDSDEVVLVDQYEFGLRNLRSEICANDSADERKQREDIIARHFANAIALMEKTADEGRLDWEQARDHVFLQLMPVEFLRRFNGERAIVSRPYVQGVLQAVVLDSEKGYLYVNEEKRANWGVSEEVLFAQARKNLDAGTLATHPQGSNGKEKFLAYIQKDGYDAARILSPTACSMAAQVLGEPFFAGLPDRDFLILWSGSNSDIFQDRVRNQLQSDFSTNAHPLLPIPLRVWKDCRVEAATQK